jgi:hypothetical protein
MNPTLYFFLVRLVGETCVHEIMIYEGDIGKDIAEGKVVLKDFYFNWLSMVSYLRPF